MRCPGGTCPSRIPPPARGTAGSPPAPSRSCPPPTACRSRTSARYSSERYVTGLRGKPISAVAALGVASPEPGQAGPADLAGYVREQWSTESLHWLRDTLYQEDKSAVRTRSGPRIIAALRNLAIGALHLAGRHDMTEATRWASRHMDRPFVIPGLIRRS